MRKTSIDIILADRNRWRFFMFGVALLGAVWIAFSRSPAVATTNGAPPPSPREGFSAPDFTLEQLDGNSVTLSSLRGNVVMVNFWATWCPPCRAEMPAIEKVYRAYKDLGLVVFGVNTTNQDNEAAVVEFVQEFDLTFPIPLDRTGSVSVEYNLRGLPSTYFIDRSGVIRSVVVGGPMSEALIQSKVEELLRETR